MRNLSPEQVKQLLDIKPQTILLDVREKWELEICQIASSLHIPMQNIPDSLEELDSEREIVVICHHGARSMQVASFLEQSGFSNIINLAGGVDAWAETVDPEMQRY